MKIFKKILAIILATLCVVSTPCISIASSAKTNSSDKKYKEYHDQINFDDLTVIAVNKNDLIVDVDPSISFYKKIKAKKYKEKYYKYIRNHPEAKNELLDAINSCNYVCAVSYTDAPLVYVEDHYERILEEDNNIPSLFSISASAEDRSATSNPSPSYKFTLKTTIYRRGTSNPYSYQATTTGNWDNSVSIIGGKENPAGGLDYIFQACPTVTGSVIFNSTYNYETSGSKNGQEGKNYFKYNGGDSWIKIAIEDDPTGLAQLNNFSLTQTFSAQSTSDTKKINSYYVHTWKTMNVNVTASGTVGTSGGKPSLGVTLNIVPEIAESSWPVYNFVSYNW